MGKFKETLFSEICDFENGDRGKNYPSRTAYVDKGIPFFSAGNISDNKINESSLNYISKERFDLLGSGKVRKGDILFCLRGSLGKFAEIEQDIDGGIASSLVIIRPCDKVNLGFLKLFLESHFCSEMIKKYDNGTAQPNLSAASLKKFKIPLPPLPEQQRIVAKLDGLFAKINQAIGLLEENIAHTQALMGSVLDKEFGRLAKKYKTKTLPNVVKKDRHSIKRGPFGSALKKAFFVEKGYKVYEQKNAIKNDFSLGHYYINDEKFEELKGFQVVPGDLIISCSGTIGKIAIAPKNIKKGIINQALLKISLDNSIISNDYFTYFFKNFVNQGQLKTKGAAIKNIVSVKELKKIPFALPTLTEQSEIVKSIKQQEILFESVLKTQTQKLTHLKALKSSLLDQAFKGEL
ncbi:restriction endonuclease subunit S [Polaribacter staleyi]|uniref:restriction endonuclease subunit S n=1 Tax=Polaribacter staleyi TaxID=2022337 RepID=UPI0031BB43CD